MRRHLKKAYAHYHKIPTWLLATLFIISVVTCIYALRHNNEAMIKLRNDVYLADKNNGNIEAALDKLRFYVYNHMNTDLSSGGNAIKPPIQLKYTYERLVQAELAPIEAANQKIYNDAQNYCQAQNPGGFFGATRIPCVQAYIASHGVKDTPKIIPPGLYEFDFASPRWSPDLAGWALVASFILLVGLIVRLLLDRLNKPVKSN